VYVPFSSPLRQFIFPVKVRAAIKVYANWPTFPMLFVGGQLIGGIDVLNEIISEVIYQTSRFKQLVRVFIILLLHHSHVLRASCPPYFRAKQHPPRPLPMTPSTSRLAILLRLMTSCDRFFLLVVSFRVL
jgi:hypothetical protein